MNKFKELANWVVSYNQPPDTRRYSVIRTPNKWVIGAKVRCTNGRFNGSEGVISYFDPNAHEDAFCMRVDPDVGERVNPANWEVEPNNILPVCRVSRDGEPLLPNNIL